MLPATLPMGRSLVVGIFSVTPDSFSDGGFYVDTDVVVERAHRMVRRGADIVDVGGKSTRPGATVPSAREERNHIGTVVAALGKTDIVVSVDTHHADTACRAIDAGAGVANDMTEGVGDSNMLSVVVSSNCLYILQRSRGNARTMNSLVNYGDIRAEITDELTVSVARAISSGVDASQIVADPGSGFAKVENDDWGLAANMAPIMELGMPVLAEVSRERFLAEIHNSRSGPTQYDNTTVVPTTYFVEPGVWGMWVHEVMASRAAVETVARLRTADTCP